MPSLKSSLLATAVAGASMFAVPVVAQDDLPRAPQPGQKAIGVGAVREAVEALPPGLNVPGRHALIVGASRYEDARIPGLPACSNDAKGLYQVLTDPTIGMFPEENVTLIVDADVTEDAVVDALDSLGRRAGKDDLVMVFFSGHGAVDSRGRSYWVMHDTYIDKLRATGLAENEITDLLGDIDTTRLVTFIDACYSASTASLGDNKSLLDVGKLYPKFSGKGRVAITASAGDQLSVVIPEGQPGHGYSAFAFHLIEGLRGKADGAVGGKREGVITVDELWGYVKDRTEGTARRAGGNQQPQLKGQVGSRFMLTIDSHRLVAASQATQNRLTKIKELFLLDRITAAQYQAAKTMLTTDIAMLDDQQRQQHKVYVDLAEGRLAPAYLNGALASLESPARRQARMDREAADRAAKARDKKIKELWAVALANDNKANGRKALAALNELLLLEPTNQTAQKLQDKIRGYYKKHLTQVEQLLANPADVLVVDANGGARFTSITAAIDAAPARSLILVRPGTYREGLVINKMVEIRGDGDLEDIVIDSPETDGVLVETDLYILRNLTIKTSAGDVEKKYFGVDLKQGTGLIDGCNISSNSLACLAVRDGANPTVRDTTIHSGAQAGLFVYDNGRGLFADIEVYGNTNAGITTKDGGNPTVRDAKIHSNQASGIYASTNGGGTYENCEVWGNKLAGLSTKEGGNPTVRNTTFRDGQQSGIYAYEKGLGQIIDCIVEDNTLSGVTISEEAELTIQDTTIRNNVESGVYAYENGYGSITDCTITGNQKAGISIKEKANLVATGCTITGNTYEGAWIRDGGQATVENCDLRNNKRGPWDVEVSAGRVLKKNNRE